MPLVKINNDNSSNIIIVKKMRDYSKDPVLIKKEEYAREFFKKREFAKSIPKKGK